MQQEFQTSKGKFLAALVAPDASNFRISTGFPGTVKGDINYDTKENIYGMGDAIPPAGNWQIIGLLSEIKEEQAKDIVDMIQKKNSMEDTYYKLYQGEFYDFTKHAGISFLSLMQSVKCYSFNPERSFSIYDPRSKTGWHEPHEEAAVTKMYNEAQERSGNWLILKSIENEQ